MFRLPTTIATTPTITTIAIITRTTATTTTTIEATTTMSGAPQEWRQSDDQKRSQQLCWPFEQQIFPPTPPPPPTIPTTIKVLMRGLSSTARRPTSMTIFISIPGPSASDQRAALFWYGYIAGCRWVRWSMWGWTGNTIKVQGNPSMNRYQKHG